MATKQRKTDPIKRIELADGRVRYRFVVDVGTKPDGKRDQRTFTFDSMREARTERARIISESARGTYVKPSKVTVEEQIAGWLATKRRSVKPTTFRHYLDVLKPVRERHGRLALQRLAKEHVEALVRDMLSGKIRRRGVPGEPLSPRSVNATLTALSMVLRDAMDNGRVVRDVTRTVKRVASDPDAGADRGEWQADDAVRFLRSVAGDRLYAAYLLSMFGLRRGEVLGLRWEHIDLTGGQAKERRLPEGTPSVAVLNNRVITLDESDNELIVEGTPKGKGRRRAPYLPIPRLLVDALTTLQLRQMEEADSASEAYGSCPQCGGAHLVVDELGQPYRPQWYSDRFVALGKALGLTRVPLHGSRHCAASLLADLGVPDVAIAAWLGHTKVEVTQGYTHVFAEQLAKTSRALGDALTGDPQPRV